MLAILLAKQTILRAKQAKNNLAQSVIFLLAVGKHVVNYEAQVSPLPKMRNYYLLVGVSEKENVLILFKIILMFTLD